MIRASATGQNEANRERLGNRPSTYRKRPPNLDCYTGDVALNIVARKVEITKANNGGLMPHGTLSGTVTKMKPTLPWLTRDTLRMHIKNLNKEKVREVTPANDVNNYTDSVDKAGTCSNNISSTISQWTLDTTATSAGDAKNRCRGTPSTRRLMTAAGTAVILQPANDDSSVFLVGGFGRPKGSTINNKRGQHLRQLESTRKHLNREGTTMLCQFD
jgi:hypothetical protein